MTVPISFEYQRKFGLLVNFWSLFVILIFDVKAKQRENTYHLAVKFGWINHFWLTAAKVIEYKITLSLQLNVPMYTTPFGPIVDGVVIPDNPLTTLSHYKTFSKYDVMFGLTESEAFHLFPASLGMSPFCVLQRPPQTRQIQQFFNSKTSTISTPTSFFTLCCSHLNWAEYYTTPLAFVDVLR